MSKNIILCADGTGNAGGYTPDSNVYKLYQAIDIHHDTVEQIVFYDNGVGTQTNRYLRAIAGAFGFGFQTNVCDLYEFLARHYEPGDNIYLFGFSRGAATIRAFNGFVDACGLIDGRGSSNRQLKDDVQSAMKAYQRSEEKARYLQGIRRHEQTPTIKFIGVWDTVSALGFPERTDALTPVLFVLDKLFLMLGFLSDKLIPHRFYNYELTPNIETACQALAIDDERTAFWPMIWKENTEEAKQVSNVQQVWFAGMHSNVGGGYERPELANVSYSWMLDQIEGLKFKGKERRNAAKACNVHGRLYNSRHGFASFFRYHPREIASLCETARAPMKIHTSVLERLRQRTANYAPRVLPEKFTLVDNAGNEADSPPVDSAGWKSAKAPLERIIGGRKLLYGVQVDLALVVLGSTLWFWNHAPARAEASGIQAQLQSVLEYFTPAMFDNIIQYLVVNNTAAGSVLLALVVLFLSIRGKARRITTERAEKLRHLLIK